MSFRLSALNPFLSAGVHIRLISFLRGFFTSWKRNQSSLQLQINSCLVQLLSYNNPKCVIRKMYHFDVNFETTKVLDSSVLR